MADAPRLMYDLETDGLLEQVSKIHCMVTLDLDTGEARAYLSDPSLPLPETASRHPALKIAGTIEEGLAYLDTAAYVTGHNIIQYDNEVIDKLYPGSVTWEGKRIMDTLVVSRLVFSNIREQDFAKFNEGDFPGYLIGSHSLAAWGLRLGYPKDDYSDRMKAAGLDPWAKLNDAMVAYCADDVCGPNHRLWRKMRQQKPDPRSVELEMAVAAILWRQEKTGVPFNERKAGELFAVLSQRRQELQDQCAAMFPPWFVGLTAVTTGKGRKVKRPDLGTVTREVRHKTTGKLLRVAEEPLTEDFVEGTAHTKVKLVEFNPSSRQHVADRLQKLYGWKPQEFGADGKPTVDDTILTSLPYPPCALLSELFMIEKRIAMLAEGRQAWLALVQRDGRIHGRVNSNGAITGRCTHSSPNLAQIPSVANASGPVPYGKESRELFCSKSSLPKDSPAYRPGWTLVGVDASGLELRCLGHFMARYDNGAYAREVIEGDVHTLNMHAAGLETRAQAKVFIYSTLYGAGPEKVGQITGVTQAEIAKYGSHKPIMEKLRKAGRRPAPELVATIRKGQLTVESFMKRTPALKALKQAVADKVSHQGYLTGLDGRILHSRSPHSALNLLLQSAGALICKRWIVELHAACMERGWREGEDFQQLIFCHDELQLDVREEIADEFGQLAAACVTRAGHFFGFKCELAGDYKIGPTWAGTH